MTAHMVIGIKMTPKTIVYYEWDDIQSFLCKELGIEEQYFSSYHTVVGGEYKNFWHFWLWFVDDKLFNDSYMPMYISDTSAEDVDSYFRKTVIDRYGEWALDILPALNALAREVGDDGFVVHYSW